jgi:phage portal protein BeeE
MVMQGLSAQEVGSDLSDLHSDVITRDAREAIASSLGVPHSLVMSNAANYATAKSDQLAFMANTVVPQARLLAHAINHQLLMPLGYHLQFEPHKTEVMQQSELEKAQAIALVVGGPVLSVDEGRELLGYEPMGETQVQEVADTKMVDIQRWRTKISRKGRDAKFSPDHLSDFEADVIRERLASGFDLDEVFKAPFTDF